MATRIRFRRGTTADWLADDEILASGEPGVEILVDGTHILRIGDGVRPFSELPDHVGATGAPGSIWYVGDGPPDPSLGKVTDFFLDDDDGTVYEKTGSVVWETVANVRGPQGIPGVPGPGMPAGSVIPFAGSAEPSGWLFCEGQAISRTTYAALYAVLGTQFGAGDGSTTFNLPNMKGRVPVGRDAAQAEFNPRGTTGGAKTHALTQAEIPDHPHAISSDGALHSHTFLIEYADDTAVGGSGKRVTDVGNVTGGGGTNATATSSTVMINDDQTLFTDGGGDGAHNNLQPYIVLNYIIKT